GGISADKNSAAHLRDCEKYSVNPFDIVVCNFYPFEKTINQENFKHEDAIFNLDIGGPAMVRCAAKNYKNVSVLVDTNDYDPFIKELKRGEISLSTRKKLSLKAFKYTQKYNQAIIDYFTSVF
ncbi:MAG: bifunctional phosphoribosylaminoimidazolecarboxamide formyltransferase/inosine monophosphate cyclohydrolase, partial [Candidatus Electrothrix sp. ATG2]|nr:bifunctional phosphoribosylaminoimidazolecarboxamide formyltransferase/inosine monophosphate cyclohydrolase [Candidatus Electrothrix sp. ATG2]